MRAVRFAAFGEPSEVLKVEELSKPELGPGQVLVRMRARPINPSDLFAIRGQYGRLPKLPATPGMEGAGVIEALGPDVTHFRVGQLVAPMNGGTWQEYVLADARSLIAIPPQLDERQAAMLMANPTSAWIMLHEVLQVEPGAWVLQNAANSAVGRFVIQLARHAGIRTINVVRRRDVIDELLADGADAVICEADEDVVARVREIAGEKGVRYAIDSVAGSSGSRLVQALGPGGTLVVFGAISGKPLTLEAGNLLFRGITIRGWWLAHWFRTASPEQRDTLFAKLAPLIADGTLHAPIAAEYDLADIQEAVAAASGSERNGKILLVG
ncbi:MAG TPA: zinc-dependent alcohol dehydrogenase family protein [Roseiflexaceae bacterium]|nr:zinc-dependent alcohol dehydrogenase family protein [Roseiflexaceae bacterium]